MDSRKNRQNVNTKRNKKAKKKHPIRNTMITLVSIIVVLAIIAGAGILGARYVVSRQSANIVSKIVPNAAVDGENLTLPASTPQQITDKLNSSADQIVSKSQGLIASAKATTNGSTVTYTLSSSKLNGLTTNALLATNGDQIQTIADKVLSSLSASGTKNPKLNVVLTDTNGKTIKTLNYSK